eukprot:UN05831
MVRPSTLFLPYSFSDQCMIHKCGNKFGDNNVARFHCRSCGRIICNKCCDFKINSYEMPNNLIRACRDCKTYCDNNEDDADDLMRSNGYNEDNDLFIGDNRQRNKIPNQAKPPPYKRSKCNSNKQ